MIITAVAASCLALAEAFVLPRRQANVPMFAARQSVSSALKAITTPVQEDTEIEKQNNEIVVGDIVFLLPSEGADTTQTKFGKKSPVDCPSLLEAATHLSKKVSWFSKSTIDASIVYVPKEGEDVEGIMARLMDVDALIAFGLSSDSDLLFALDVFGARRQRKSSGSSRQCQFAIECAKNLPSTVSSFR